MLVTCRHIHIYIYIYILSSQELHLIISCQAAQAVRSWNRAALKWLDVSIVADQPLWMGIGHGWGPIAPYLFIFFHCMLLPLLPLICSLFVSLSLLVWLTLRQWYDVAYRGPDNDFTSTTGFLIAIRDTLRLRPGALLWGGIPCCSHLDWKCTMISLIRCMSLVTWSYLRTSEQGIYGWAVACMEDMEPY
jgi:hypothetical protein